MKTRLLALTITILGLVATPAFAQDPPPDPVDVVDAGAVELAGVPDMPSAAAPSDAQPAPTAKEGASEAELATDLYGAIKAGRWIVVAGLVLLILVALVRRFAGEWGKTRAGGYVISYAVPIASALGLSLAAGQWGIGIFVAAIGAGLAAQGLHTSAKDAAG